MIETHDPAIQIHAIGERFMRLIRDSKVPVDMLGGFYSVELFLKQSLPGYSVAVQRAFLEALDDSNGKS